MKERKKQKRLCCGNSQLTWKASHLATFNCLCCRASRSDPLSQRRCCWQLPLYRALGSLGPSDPLSGFSPGKPSSLTAVFPLQACARCTRRGQRPPERDLNSCPGVKMSSASPSPLIAVIRTKALPARLQSSVSELSLQSIN